MIESKCQFCKHYTLFKTCDAFPGGIPENIFNGDLDHSEPTKNQKNDIVYEPIK